MLKQIHSRIEQKFKDYRNAFRHFDLNFDSQLSFEEFVVQSEFIGVSMSINDFKLVFKTLDYDNKSEIDF